MDSGWRTLRGESYRGSSRIFCGVTIPTMGGASDFKFGMQFGLSPTIKIHSKKKRAWLTPFTAERCCFLAKFGYCHKMVSVVCRRRMFIYCDKI